MKLNLYVLANMDEKDIPEFLRINKISIRDMEYYVGGLLNRYNLVFCQLKTASDKLPLKSHLLSEAMDQLQYFEEQIILLNEIKRNFHLFQNVPAPKTRVGFAAAQRLLKEIANNRG